MWEPEAKGKKSGILILSPLMIIVIEMSLLAHCWDTVLPRRPEGMGLILAGELASHMARVVAPK